MHANSTSHCSLRSQRRCCSHHGSCTHAAQWGSLERVECNWNVMAKSTARKGLSGPPSKSVETWFSTRGFLSSHKSKFTRVFTTHKALFRLRRRLSWHLRPCFAQSLLHFSLQRGACPRPFFCCKLERQRQDSVFQFQHH